MGCVKGKAVRVCRPAQLAENSALAATKAFRSAPLPDVRSGAPEWPLVTRELPLPLKG